MKGSLGRSSGREAVRDHVVFVAVVSQLAHREHDAQRPVRDVGDVPARLAVAAAAGGHDVGHD